MKARNQYGVNMVGLIVWAFLAVIVMGGVVTLFANTSQQTAVGAEQNQQQQSILNALNRTSRDVSISNPIVYASSTDLVLDVPLEDGTVERRRYFLNLDEKKVWEYTKEIERGDAYDTGAIDAYWNTDVQRKSSTVYSVDTSVLGEKPFLKYYDSKGVGMGSVPITGSKNTEAIARVDINLTAEVANKGKVSLSTSAVPRTTTNLGANATPILASCPAFTATREGSNVVLRWDKAEGATAYEVSRNGVTLTPITNVSDPTQTKYSFTDTPGESSDVLSYMLKVVAPSGISNCIDTMTFIVNSPSATQLSSDLVPLTTRDASNNPISTAWTNSSETTQVELKWQKISTATGYVLYKRPLDSSGAYTGSRVTVATLEAYPYIDEQTGAKRSAPANLSYRANAGWDEHWEWSIKVISRTGDNDSTPEIRTLSYPKPVTTASISAVPLSGTGAVSSADIAAGKGNNKVTWTYNWGMDARGFDIYRSAIDAPAANFPAGFTKVASVDNDVREYIDRNAAFGSTYGYYVVAKNRSGFGNAYASQRVQQLQFPPDPVVTTVSATGSRDMDNRTNRVMWASAKSATGYHVERANINATSIVCLSGANCSANSGGVAATENLYIDSRSDVTPASRYTYAAFAYNATGVSPKLGANVVLTQRPAAPALNKTSSPTLTTRVTGTSWDHTAGSWCVSGAYTASGNNCEYEQNQYSNNGSLRTKDSQYLTSYNWGNQEWGKNYSYNVRARNAAISGDGWSDYSATVRAETYPGPIATSIWNGNASGGEAQRVNYDSSTATGGWGNVRKEGKTTISIGDAYGSGYIYMVRVHDGNQATSYDDSLLLPPWDTPAGWWSDHDGTKITARTWSMRAAPGTTYRYDVTARSIENSLERTLSTGNTTTPADVPMKGGVAVVCYGAGNGDGTGLQSHPGQIISTRTVYSDVRSRYGFYSRTAMLALNGTSPQNYWGFKWFDVAKGASADGITADNGQGYFHNITYGFDYTNVAEGRTNSATLSGFINNSIYTYDGCPRTGGVMQEPSDACYVSTYQGCATLNESDRPKWLSR